MLRVVWLASCFAGVCACAPSLDVSLEQHSCSPEGRCLAGYECSPEHICVRSGESVREDDASVDVDAAPAPAGKEAIATPPVSGVGGSPRVPVQGAPAPRAGSPAAGSGGVAGVDPVAGGVAVAGASGVGGAAGTKAPAGGSSGVAGAPRAGSPAAGSSGAAAGRGGAPAAGSGGDAGGRAEAPKGSRLEETFVVRAGETFDGKGMRYTAGSAIGDGSQDEDQKPM
ncbi:MAG TPA: hypothetical protein VJV78_26090, partial [Polyangiales bacterium]|nr:hypothetical protein [Polyangiales bacterium]